MKQKWILFSLIGMCTFLGLNSCSLEDKSMFGDDFDIPKLTDANTIQFTVEGGGNWGELLLYAGGGRMAIEWGDGRIQKIEDPSVEQIKYKYGNLRHYRVRIWAEELEYCGVSGFLLPISDVHVGYLPQMKNLELNSIKGVSKLDISSSCPNLEVINVGNMADLEYIDFNQCKNLEKVLVYTNPKLTSLNLNNLHELEVLHCSGNAITSLPLKGLSKLKVIECSFNERLSEIEVDNHNLVETLLIEGCNLRSMSFIGRMPLLRELNCNSNQLTELDLSGNLSICYVNCANNRIGSLQIPSQSYMLQLLNCKSNELGKDVLNAIFEDLKRIFDSHYESRFINYSNNPGEHNCRNDIPVMKGWKVENHT